MATLKEVEYGACLADSQMQLALSAGTNFTNLATATIVELNDHLDESTGEEIRARIQELLNLRTELQDQLTQARSNKEDETISDEQFDSFVNEEIDIEERLVRTNEQLRSARIEEARLRLVDICFENYTDLFGRGDSINSPSLSSVSAIANAAVIDCLGSYTVPTTNDSTNVVVDLEAAQALFREMAAEQQDVTTIAERFPTLASTLQSQQPGSGKTCRELREGIIRATRCIENNDYRACEDL